MVKHCRNTLFYGVRILKLSVGFWFAASFAALRSQYRRSRSAVLPGDCSRCRCRYCRWYSRLSSAAIGDNFIFIDFILSTVLMCLESCMEFTYLLLNVRVNVIKTIHPLDLPWTYPLGRGNRHPPPGGIYILVQKCTYWRTCCKTDEVLCLWLSRVFCYFS